MNTRYKIVISGRNIYEEIELGPERDALTIGTAVECDVRLHRELFFGQVELFLNKVDGEWVLTCSDNLYITMGDVRKLVTKTLIHGEIFGLKYQNSDMAVFDFTFMLDFDYEVKDYNIAIELDGRNQITVGGNPEAEIYISDENIGPGGFKIALGNGDVYVVDERSRYGVYVNGIKITQKTRISDCCFISIAGFSFYYKQYKLYTSSSGAVQFRGLMTSEVDTQSTHFRYPDFVRNTRVQYRIPETEIEIQQPSPKPQKPKKNLLLSLIPTLTMLVLMVVLRGIMGSGGLFVVYSVCSMGIGAVMSVVTYRLDGKKYKEDVAKREDDYKKYISGKEELIQTARIDELRIRNLIYESVENGIQEVRAFGKRIFEKSTGDKDFLDVYLGTGTVEAAIPVKYSRQEFVDVEDPISMLPEETEKKYHWIQNAPIISRFYDSCGIGIVGPKPVLNDILRNIVLDLSIRHFYGEVKTYFVLDESDTSATSWIRWLRHAYNDELGIRNILCDDESRKLLLENLYSILSFRESVKKESETVKFDVNYVVFVLDSAAIRNHPISKYIDHCSAYDFTFVFFEEYEELLPKGCTEIIRLDGNAAEGVLLKSENGEVQSRFLYSPIPVDVAEQTALKLGAVSVQEVSLESELTKSITMFQMLQIFSVDDLDLKERWAKSQVYKSMAAPLGVKTKNEIVYLDISDKSSAHGPHGLVAGTTGSGKSEILQTYVLSMATLFHPWDVGFVIIDFKGGGMANQFKDLPHMMGAITNIDGREINRSLLSIKAELVKRQSYFAEAGVNHINDYIKLYKDHKVSKPLPHLIIIVDEFAELKAEYPDFMKELISAARIGRTLGVHLILATQKPAGVVDAQIWSNSKFRLCLKVQTKEDSNEVIKTPLAAEIVEPGRAYFQVGNNEIFELFQSAFSGAKVESAAGSQVETYTIFELNTWGKRKAVYTNKCASHDANSINQLQAIVAYVSEYCEKNHIKPMNGICLPPLPDVLKSDSLAEPVKDLAQGCVISIGLYDNPERQEQGSYCINISEGNTYIVGSAMTGKTTVLQTILLQLMCRYTPQEVNVYIIDCGNMALKVFENSRMVGGVALTAEEEKIKNLFKLLFRTIEERKKILSDKGLGTYMAYLEAGFTDMPQIVLMIDNMAAFREYYDELSDDFLSLSREASSLGISIIATAATTNAMHYRALSNFGTRIALVCNDSGEYMNLFDRCRMEPKEIPGRGLCMVDKQILEFQTALCVDGDKEFERVENAKKIIQAQNGTFGQARAKPIPFVPELLVKADVKAENPELYQRSYQVPVGMDFNSVQFISVDLRTIGYFAVTGKPKSGKTNFVYNILSTIQENIFDNLTRAYIFDDSRMSLEDCEAFGFVEKYELDEAEIQPVIENVSESLEQRAQLIRANKGAVAEDILREEPLLLLVIENRAVIDFIAKDAGLMALFKNILNRCGEAKICVIFSNIENANVAFNAAEPYKMIKNNKKYFAFTEVADFKLIDASVQQQKQNSKPLKRGDAFMCFDGTIQRIRTVLCGKGMK